MDQDRSIVLCILRPRGVDLVEDLVKEIVRAIVDVADPDRIILFGSRGDGCARGERFRRAGLEGRPVS